MQWYDAQQQVPTYWYSRQAPRFAENVRLTGELEANGRFPVQVTRGISQTSLYHDAVDPAQAHNVAQQTAYHNKQQALRRTLRAFLLDVGAPAEVLNTYLA